MSSTTIQDTAPKDQNDLVLKSARVILIFTKWIVILGIAALAIGLAVIPFTYQDMLTEIAKAFVNSPKPEIFGMIALIMVLGVVMLLLTLFALNRLRRVVDSVGEGNPFTRINGTRLRGIGIAALAIQIISFFGGMLATGVVTMLGKPKPGTDFDLSIDAGISLTGVLLVLLLIILARVFDRGAEMREELEGTI